MKGKRETSRSSDGITLLTHGVTVSAAEVIPITPEGRARQTL